MRYFLLDKVTDLVAGERARGVKSVSLSDEVLHDHFRDFPVMPGALILEGLSHLGGFLLDMTFNRPGEPVLFALLAQVKNAKFYDVSGPGDRLEMEVIVCLHHRSSSSEASVRSVAGEIERGGGAAADLVRFDVRDSGAIEAAVAGLVERHGRIDGWVNNAGIHHGGLLVSMAEAEIRDLVEVNLVGTILCARAVLPIMMRQKGGVIVNVGSATAQRPARGQAVYAATKGAIEALTRALAHEYGRKGIRVHAVLPGPIETDMLAAFVPLGHPDEEPRAPGRKPVEKVTSWIE